MENKTNDSSVTHEENFLSHIRKFEDSFKDTLNDMFPELKENVNYLIRSGLVLSGISVFNCVFASGTIYRQLFISAINNRVLCKIILNVIKDGAADCSDLPAIYDFMGSDAFCDDSVDTVYNSGFFIPSSKSIHIFENVFDMLRLLI
ncbi:MAG: hypothetical protein LBF83_05765 [Spirochaetaceae bacterium]|nr:hypothetical protein [Spirochaetaceae bacterium]